MFINEFFFADIFVGVLLFCVFSKSRLIFENFVVFKYFEFFENFGFFENFNFLKRKVFLKMLSF